MSIPNRTNEVAAIVAHPMDLFGSEDGRRRILDVICAGLNVQDGGNWGKLEKPGPRTPADIIVWRPTLEHADVLTDSGPMWHVHGPIQPDWKWVPGQPTTRQ